MELYRRKLLLVALLLAVYLGVSLWVPYSKLWLIQDLMETQARLYFATQSPRELRDYLVRKAEALELPLDTSQVTVQNVNGEVVYLDLDLEVPLELPFYHRSLHFRPKTFGLIRGFASAAPASPPDSLDPLAGLSDSTRGFLRGRTLGDYLQEFFAR